MNKIKNWEYLLDLLFINILKALKIFKICRGKIITDTVIKKRVSVCPGILYIFDVWSNFGFRLIFNQNILRSIQDSIVLDLCQNIIFCLLQLMGNE
jgi:hypothetical protein